MGESAEIQLPHPKESHVPPEIPGRIGQLDAPGSIVLGESICQIPHRVECNAVAEGQSWKSAHGSGDLMHLQGLETLQK
jgi:hypothetical protein